jgi:ferredoxin
MVSIWTHKEESKLSFLLQHYHNINLPYLNTTGEEYTRRPKMKAKVDRETCVGSEQCTQTCPEVFKMEGGKSMVHTDPVPKEAEDKCREAAQGCPSGAISIEE